MKNFILITILFTTLFSCSPDDSQSQSDERTASELIIGRWKVLGFENTVMHEITVDQVHTIYSTDGNFGDISTAIPGAHDYTVTGNVYTEDLNFGNMFTADLVFKCDGNVVEFVDDSGTTGRIYFRENYNYPDCNQ